MEACMKLTKSQLQDILRKAGKPVSGNKPELCQRIFDNGLSLTVGSSSPRTVLPSPVRSRSPPRAPIAQPGPQAVMRQELDRCNKMAYRDIQNELRKYNLKLTGTKEVLCQRLAEYLTIGQARRQQGPLPAAVAPPTSPQPGLLKPKAFSLAECNNWTVAQLKERLKELGQPSSGNKLELCQRLAEYEKAQLPSTKQVHSIAFLEAANATPENIRGAKPIAINGRMYNFIRQGPVPHNQFQGRLCQGNAYVFGPLLDLNGYTLIASHGNDAASTGFVDLDIFNQSNGTFDTDVFEQFFVGDWDDRDALRQLQQTLPSVLWLGNTDLGDVGAELYAHYDKNGEIDSLIVDSDCLFPNPDEDN